MSHIFFRTRSLINKNLFVNKPIKRFASEDVLNFGDIQSGHVTHPKLTIFVNSYYRTNLKSDTLKQSFLIDLRDNKLFGYKDILNFGDLFHHDNNLPIEVKVNDSSILMDRLKHRLDADKLTVSKKELFLYGLNALKLAYLDLRANENFLDMSKSIGDIEQEYNVNIQHMILQKILSIVEGYPENLVLFTFRKHIFDLQDLKTLKQYKNMELVIALYGYIAMIGDKRKFLQVSSCILQKIKIN